MQRGAGFLMGLVPLVATASTALEQAGGGLAPLAAQPLLGAPMAPETPFSARAPKERWAGVNFASIPGQKPHDAFVLGSWNSSPQRSIGHMGWRVRVPTAGCGPVAIHSEA